MNLFPKKSLGQHFLTDIAIAEKIVHQLDGFDFSTLIEVGPGKGMLTQFLYKSFRAKLTIVEFDDRMVEHLRRAYAPLGNRIIHQDFLEFDWSKPLQTPIAVIGNFPYNISTEIVFKVLDNKERVTIMAGMFQKEVAKRICATHGNKDYGITSVITQAYYNAEYLFDVAPEYFSPPPKVTSGVMRLIKKNPPPQIADEINFRQLVKKAFSQRRKMLSNALKGFPGIEKALPQKFENKRAEQLSVDNFIRISNAITAGNN
jgi:16S rRNA (adenine1518-N6/adenine1519-N6)-dimethyltransferase